MALVHLILTRRCSILILMLTLVHGAKYSLMYEAKLTNVHIPLSVLVKVSFSAVKVSFSAVKALFSTAIARDTLKYSSSLESFCLIEVSCEETFFSNSAGNP